jgi:hypothetical protein
VYQPAASIDVVFGAAQSRRGDRPHRTSGEMLVEGLRQPMPEAFPVRCRNARRLVDKNDAHGLSSCSICWPNVRLQGYEFETERIPSS